MVGGFVDIGCVVTQQYGTSCRAVRHVIEGLLPLRQWKRQTDRQSKRLRSQMSHQRIKCRRIGAEHGPCIATLETD